LRPAIGAIIALILGDPNSGKARRANGANFCHEVRRSALIHEIEVITDGNQKWHGAAPNFSINDIIRRSVHHEVIIVTDHSDILDRSINAEPRACARKYLIHASVS
jgi:hypothetical protein